MIGSPIVVVDLEKDMQGTENKPGYFSLLDFNHQEQTAQSLLSRQYF
jgi:hypothetical protein